MVAIFFSPRARQDLEEIGDYIAQESRAHARRFVAKLLAQCELISRAPLSYPIRADLAADLRMAAIARYLIFFRVMDEKRTVRIERVLHSARDITRLM